MKEMSWPLRALVYLTSLMDQIYCIFSPLREKIFRVKKDYKWTSVCFCCSYLLLVLTGTDPTQEKQK